MANNNIRTNTGSYGVNDAPAVGPLMQGQAGVVMTFTLTDLGGTVVNLTGLTMTGTITNTQTKATAALQGAIALVTPASGVFSWTTHEDDVGTAGEFLLTFKSGTSLITLPAYLSIIETPAATTTFGAALVGVTVAEAAWLSAALATVPDATNLPDPTGATDGHVWTADGADGAGWEAAAGGGGASDVGDLTTTGLTATNMLRVAAAGGLEERTPAQVLSDIGAADLGDWTVTDETFGLDMTGSDPQTFNTLVVAPYSSGMTWRENYTRAANATLPTDNTVKNWGWNVGGGGGRYDTDEVATYLQLERYFELTAGAAWSEWHLNFYNSGDGHRPFQWNIRHSDAYTTAGYNIDSMVWMDRAGLVTYAAMTTPASGNGALEIDDLTVEIDTNATAALSVKNGGSVLFNANTTGNYINIGGGSYTATFNVLGTSQYFYLPTATSGTPIGMYNSLTASHASASSAVMTGLGLVATNGSAYNLAELIGAKVTARNDAAGTVATLAGLSVEAGALTSRTATNVAVLNVQPYLAGTTSFAQGVYVRVPTGGANTVFIYGVRVENQGKAGMNTAYGVKIEDQTGAGSNYALYTGAGLVRLGDNIYIADGKNFVLSGTTGTKLASLTNEKLGFWGATPVVQQVLATGGGATVDNVITLLQTIGLCKQS